MTDAENRVKARTIYDMYFWYHGWRICSIKQVAVPHLFLLWFNFDTVDVDGVIASLGQVTSQHVTPYVYNWYGESCLG